jgi:CHAT domain-containing protein/tetratricopeptide (TPR) repeat protein
MMLPRRPAPQPNNAPLAQLLKQIELLPLQPATAHLRLRLDEQALKLVQRAESPLLWAQLHSDTGLCWLVSPTQDTRQKLEQAAWHYGQAALVYTPSTHWEEWHDMQHNLATAYMQHAASAQDLEKAIALYQQILACCARAQHPHEGALTHYELGRLYERRGPDDESDNIEQAIAHCEQALQGWTRATEPVYWAEAHDLLGILYRRRLIADPLDNLARSLEHHQAALTAIEPLRSKAAYLWGRIQHNLGRTWFHWSELHGGRQDDVEQAIRHYQLALQTRTPARPVEWAETLHDLANACLERRTGDPAENIEQALQHLEQVLSVRTRERYPVEWAKTQMALGNVYFRRLTGGRAENIEQALVCYQAAWHQHKRTGPDREKALTLHNLAVACSERLTGNRWVNLKHARWYGERALAYVDPQDIQLRGLIETDLIDLLWKLGNLDPAGDYIEQAIRHGEDLLALLVGLAYRAQRALACYNLGNAYGDRRRGDRAENQARAIVYYQQALELFDAQDLFRQADTHNNLGVTYLERSAHAGDLLQAILHLQRALDLYPPRSLPASVRRTARNLGHLYFEGRRWKEATNTYQRAIEASEQLYQTSLKRVSKQVELAETAELYQRAAYAQACQKDYTQAVTMLERGRARLLGEALERDRTDLERLPQLGYADLYKEYLEAAEQVEQWEQVELGARKAKELAVTQQQARARLEAAIEQIRKVQNYADFFRLPDWTQVQQALTAKTTQEVGIYLSILSPGGVALIVHAGGVQPVWLDFNGINLNDLLVTRREEKVIGGYLPAQLGAAPLAETLDTLLPRLGEQIMQPIVAALDKILPRSTNGQVRSVILIPTGRLALLPLHAACYTINGKEQTILDDLMATYTPSALALGHCREMLAVLPEGQPSLFGIGNPLPLPEGIKPLEFARPEVEELVKFFDKPSTLLYETDATRPAVENGLGKSTHLHLSCHGQFNAEDSLSSGVILSNGEMITLRDLIARPMLKGTRLAVLSACQTAITDFDKLPEEAIGLPAGFLQAGVPGVVGSLWPVNDLSTALLMIKFYEYHLRGDAKTGEGPLPPASALRKAQLWLRDVTNAELSELFDMYRKATPNLSTRMTYELAQERFREHTLRDPNDRPFAHPYYWAAFAFYGV